MREDTYANRLVMFEVAQECLCSKMAGCTATIFEEQKTPIPDQNKIDLARKDFDRLHDELDRLTPSDVAGINAILKR